MGSLINIHKVYKNRFNNLINASGYHNFTNNIRVSKVKKMLSTLDLYEPWEDMLHQMNYFNNADKIIACSQTNKLARQFNSAKNVVVMEDISDFELSVLNSKSNYINCIGVISPFLVDSLLNSPSILSTIKSVCTTLILFSDAKHIDQLMLRRALHKSGFYEVAIPSIEGSDQFDYSSVGVMPDGTHDLYSNYPGLSLSKSCIYVASKLPLTNYFDSKLNWMSIIGCPLIDSNGDIEADNEFFVITISNSEDKPFNPDSDTISIQAKAKWKSYGIGHSSLIGSYQGPSDSYMFAALLQLVDDSTVSVSLWKNDGKWVQLSASNVFVEQKQEESYSIQFSLLISPSIVIVKVEDELLLKYEDTLLKRTGIVGIRLYSNVIALSNISINKQ